MMRGGKRQMTKGIELPHLEKIRMLGEKEMYIYLGILEADTLKQVEMKGKNLKQFRRGTKIYSIPNYIAGTL